MCRRTTCFQPIGDGIGFTTVYFVSQTNMLTPATTGIFYGPGIVIGKLFRLIIRVGPNRTQPVEALALWTAAGGIYCGAIVRVSGDIIDLFMTLAIAVYPTLDHLQSL